jgi:uncharacterized protein
MIDGVLVVDATVHGANFQPENIRHPAMHALVKMLYHWAADHLHPHHDPRYRLTYEQFQRLFRLQPRLLEQLLFAESDVDVAVYQSVPLYGLFHDGSSPIAVADEIRRRWPHRMFTYGDATPWQHDIFAHIDRLVDEHQVLGLKLYPLDMVEGEIRPVRFDDEERVFPLIEHARARGLKVIAVHKAVPLGPVAPIDCYGLEDMAPPIQAFPDMIFEIVHGGMAFCEETAVLLERYPNVSVNLESTPCFALNFADNLADMLAPLLATGAHDRLFFATGVPIMHPAPFVEAFWRFEMPRGYPRLTPEMKQGILGANFARQHGWDVATLKARCASDVYGHATQKAEPWSMVRELEREQTQPPRS